MGNLIKLNENMDLSVSSELVCADFLVSKLGLSTRIGKLIIGPKGL
jgi:hypothetical protein